MNTHQTNFIPGVYFVGLIDSDRLPRGVALQGIAGKTIPVMTDVIPVRIFCIPEASCTSSKEGAVSSDTATLRFRSADDIPRSSHIAFVIAAASGRQYLIGSREIPRVSVKCVRSAGTSNEPAGFEYEVTHVALKSMIPCSFGIPKSK